MLLWKAAIPYRECYHAAMMNLSRSLSGCLIKKTRPLGAQLLLLSSSLTYSYSYEVAYTCVSLAMSALAWTSLQALLCIQATQIFQLNPPSTAFTSLDSSCIKHGARAWTWLSRHHTVCSRLQSERPRPWSRTPLRTEKVRLKP